MSDTLPFPWSDDSGLCPVLSHASMWATAFASSDNRQMIKKAAKARGAGRIVKTDDNAIGRTVIELLETVPGRHRLGHELCHRNDKQWRTPIASNLYLFYICKNLDNLPPEQEVCDYVPDQAEEKQKPFLNQSRFAAWLERTEINAEMVLPIALFASAFAILQEDIGPNIYRILVDRDPAFVPFVGIPAPQLTASPVPATSNAISTSSTPVTSKTNERGPPQLRPEKSRSEIRDPDQLTQLEQSIADLHHYFPPEKLAEAAKLLFRLGKKHKELCQKLLDVRARLQDRLREVSCLPWLKGPPAVDSVPTLKVVYDQLERLAYQERDVEQVLQVHHQLNALYERLGEPPAAFVPAETNLITVSECLKKHADDCQNRLQEIGLREQAVKEFVDGFLNAPTEAGINLLKNADDNRWIDLAGFVVGPEPRSELGKSCGALVGQVTLLGIAIVALWPRKPNLVGQLLDIAVKSLPLEEDSPLNEVLSFCPIDLLQEIAQQQPALAPAMTQNLFASAFGSDHPGDLEYLAPLLETSTLEGSCARMYRTAVEAFRRGMLTEPRRQLAEAAQKNMSANPDPNRSERFRRDLLDFVRRIPSMSGYYHKLRQWAQRKYLEPLVPDIEARTPATVRRRWEQYGGLERMVEECITGSVKRKELDRSHQDQTQKYLEQFETCLERWEMSRASATHAEDDGLRTVFQGLERAAGQGIAQAISLVGVIRRLSIEEDFLSSDRRCAIVDDVPVLVHPESAIKPEMTRSWPAFVSEKPVQVLDFLADLLRKTLAPLTLDQAVEDYLRREEFQAAKSAADGNEVLRAHVAAKLAECRDRVRAQFADLLRRADLVQTRDEYIPLCLNEIEKTLEDLRFDIVDSLVAELDRRVRRQEILNDPVRQSLLVFLREGGASPEEESVLELLREQAEEMRRQNKDCRLHLDEMARHRDPESLPTELVDRLAELTRRADRPSLWPDAEISLEIADHLEQIFRFVTGRFRGGQANLSVRMSDWLCAQWMRATEGDPEERLQARQALAHVANAIAQYYPEGKILELLGPAPASVEPLPPLREESSTVMQSIEKTTAIVPDRYVAPRLAVEATGSTEKAGASSWATGLGHATSVAQPASTEATADITSRLRQYLRKRAEQEPPSNPTHEEDLRALRTAARASQWATALPLAVAAVREGSFEGPLRPEEAVLAIIMALNSPANDLEAGRFAYQNACLSVLLTWEGRDGFLREEFRNFIVVRAVAEMHRPVSSDHCAAPELAVHLRNALEVWTDDLPDADPAVRDVARLIQQAETTMCPDGSLAVIRLASTLWEAAKHLIPPEAISRARGDLLVLLYRLRQREALRQIAAQSTQLGDLIVLCLNAFDQAQSNPMLIADAGSYAAAYRDQAAGKKNYRPWLQLFDSLDFATTGDESPVICELVSDFVAREYDGSATLQIRLAPSVTDRPSTLNIELGITETAGRPQNLLGDEEALLKEKIVDIRLSPVLVATAGDVIRIPYKVTGLTIRRRQIDLSGTWEVPFSSQVMEPINEGDILVAWPGAGGSPVRSLRGFHGRELQMQKIEKLLCDSDRPRSIMLIGERRIGKTSLLWEMVAVMGPSKDRICGAFLDAAGLNLTANRSLARIFFDFVVRYLLQEDANGHLQAALRQHGGKNAARALARPEWLAEKFTPDTSLKIALEQLTEWLHEHTDHRVPRLALFVDEFDKFIKPMLTGHADEVNKLMWGLREVVQRSNRVALVLAGSGLLKLFVQGLDQPLHQSIFVLELETFSRGDSSDWRAVGDTFLPSRLRKWLSPERPVEALIEHAAAYCGCHPYYLAMLGYAAAIESHGHPLTPAVLNRVVERMILGKVQATVPISSDIFYTPLFVSLGRLEPRQMAVAQVLLVSVARRTTAELPELPKWHLAKAPHADPELTELTTEEERWQAYRVLLMERALEEDDGKSRVRLRVPLSAAALRHDAVEIRQSALKTLREKKGP